MMKWRPFAQSSSPHLMPFQKLCPLIPITHVPPRCLSDEEKGKAITEHRHLLANRKQKNAETRNSAASMTSLSSSSLGTPSFPASIEAVVGGSFGASDDDVKSHEIIIQGEFSLSPLGQAETRRFSVQTSNYRSSDVSLGAILRRR